MEIDISEYGRNHSPLRCAAICGIPFPILHIASFEHQLHQRDNTFVIYLLFQYFQQFLMINIVKEAFDIKLYYPLDPVPLIFCLHKSGMAAPLVSKLMRIP